MSIWNKLFDGRRRSESPASTSLEDRIDSTVCAHLDHLQPIIDGRFPNMSEADAEHVRVIFGATRIWWKGMKAHAVGVANESLATLRAVTQAHPVEAAKCQWVLSVVPHPFPEIIRGYELASRFPGYGYIDFLTRVSFDERTNPRMDTTVHLLISAGRHGCYAGLSIMLVPPRTSKVIPALVCQSLLNERELGHAPKSS